MKVMLCLLLLSAPLLASVCPTTTTLDVLVGLGSAGCEWNGITVSNWSFSSPAIVDSDIAVQTDAIWNGDNTILMTGPTGNYAATIYLYTSIQNIFPVTFVSIIDGVTYENPIVTRGGGNFSDGTAYAYATYAVTTIPASVPEPSSLLLGLTGLGSSSLLRFRRSK